MPFRLGLTLATLLIAGSPARGTAQSTAAAVVRATVHPGKCPVHSHCGGNHEKGPKAKEKNTGGPTAGAASVETPLVALDVGAPTDVRPLRIVLRPPDLRRDDIGLAADWAADPGARQDRSTALSRRDPDLLLVLQEIGAGGLWLYGLPRSASPLNSASRGPITIVVEY
jgi:hypothetical protein